MKYALAAMMAVLAFNVVTPVNAHSTLVRCDPAVAATLSAPPDQIRCWFSEDLDATKSTMSVAAAGQRVDKGDAHVDLKAHDRRQMVVTLDTTRMGDGAYNVSWQTLSTEDGEPGGGEFVFEVRTAKISPLIPSSRTLEFLPPFAVWAGLPILGAVLLSIAAIWRMMRRKRVPRTESDLRSHPWGRQE